MTPPLQTFLNRLYAKYHRTEYLSSDPLEFAHSFGGSAVDAPWDQEAVALLAAVLAYGNVKQIRSSVSRALERMLRLADSPSRFVRRLEDPVFVESAKKEFSGFVHRFNRGEDVVVLFRLLSKSWSAHGSLGAHFLAFLEPESAHIGEALNGLIADWRGWAVEMRPAPSFYYLLTAPADGSCCKRWCMFLRWMGRDDRLTEGLDLGLWARGSPLAATFPDSRVLRPGQLILPLDTHTGRISQYLGLTRRKSLNWKAALEITERLKACDPADPTRYDFAMSRLGILDLCQLKYRPEVCSRCELLPVCRYARAGRKKQERARRNA